MGGYQPRGVSHNKIISGQGFQHILSNRIGYIAYSINLKAKIWNKRRKKNLLKELKIIKKRYSIAIHTKWWEIKKLIGKLVILKEINRCCIMFCQKKQIKRRTKLSLILWMFGLIKSKICERSSYEKYAQIPNYRFKFWFNKN